MPSYSRGGGAVAVAPGGGGGPPILVSETVTGGGELAYAFASHPLVRRVLVKSNAPDGAPAIYLPTPGTPGELFEVATDYTISPRASVTVAATEIAGGPVAGASVFSISREAVARFVCEGAGVYRVAVAFGEVEPGRRAVVTDSFAYLAPDDRYVFVDSTGGTLDVVKGCFLPEYPSTGEEHVIVNRGTGLAIIDATGFLGGGTRRTLAAGQTARAVWSTVGGVWAFEGPAEDSGGGASFGAVEVAAVPVTLATATRFVAIDHTVGSVAITLPVVPPDPGQTITFALVGNATPMNEIVILPQADVSFFAFGNSQPGGISVSTPAEVLTLLWTGDAWWLVERLDQAYSLAFGATNAVAELNAGKGSAYGIATLDGDGKITAAQRPDVAGNLAGTFAAMPATPGPAGQMYFPTDGLTPWRSDGAAWRPIVHRDSGALGTRPPLFAAWTLHGAALTTGADEKGAIRLAVPSSATQNSRILWRPKPATPCGIECVIRFHPTIVAGINNGLVEAGLCFWDSTSGKVEGFDQYFTQNAVGHSVQTLLLNSITSWNSSPTTYDNPRYRAGVTLRAVDDGVNHVFSASLDGVVFTQLATRARASWLGNGGDRWGVILSPGNQIPMDVSVISWREF